MSVLAVGIMIGFLCVMFVMIMWFFHREMKELQKSFPQSS